MAGTTTQLARLNQMEQALAEAKTLEEFKATADMSQTFAHWAKKVGAARAVCNHGTDVFIRAKRGMGRLLGEPPGRGPGRGNKTSHPYDVLDREEIRRCRAVAYKVPDDVYERYCMWLQHHSEDHLTFRDVLMLAKLGDLQEPVLSVLETGKAQSLGAGVCGADVTTWRGPPPTNYLVNWGVH